MSMGRLVIDIRYTCSLQVYANQSLLSHLSVAAYGAGSRRRNFSFL